MVLELCLIEWVRATRRFWGVGSPGSGDRGIRRVGRPVVIGRVSTDAGEDLQMFYY